MSLAAAPSFAQIVLPDSSTRSPAFQKGRMADWYRDSGTIRRAAATVRERLCHGRTFGMVHLVAEAHQVDSRAPQHPAAANTFRTLAADAVRSNFQHARSRLIG